MMREARFYTKLENNKVQCHLCRHNCIISEGRFGICGVRKNEKGTLYTLVYNYPVAINVDPIEKKPLYHFLPGSRALSIATVGCNFSCKFCQNYDIAQAPKYGEIFGEHVPRETVVALAEKYRCESISYTYTEPTIFYEYAYDIAVLAKSKGIKNTFVTNGYIEEDPLKEIAPFLDSANIDLKSFRKEFYAKIVGARLDQVLESIKLYFKMGIWIELTTLIIPGYNDSEEELRDIARFIKKELAQYVPWHVSRFYPHYKMSNVPPTPVKKVLRAREIGLKEGLLYVYAGNIPGDEGNDTYCPNCKRVVIRRKGFWVVENHARGGICEYCGSRVHGIF
ncbi:MAG: AmmeMemoRadiSam system radical SAM enzyme [bacterium]|nr:AmmeMemoRadiSam system radical SAM enzyme [bacterium]